MNRKIRYTKRESMRHFKDVHAPDSYFDPPDDDGFDMYEESVRQELYSQLSEDVVDNHAEHVLKRCKEEFDKNKAVSDDFINELVSEIKEDLKSY